jgi:transposase
MRDVDFYQQIFGLSDPWSVKEVKLDVDSGRVDVFVEHGEDCQWFCPQCDRQMKAYDHAPERTWRHLDTCQLMTFLHGRIPRVNCSEHGVHQVRVPWAEPGSRFTLLFEQLAIDVLMCCQTVKGAATVLRLSWDQTFGIMQRAVDRGLANKQAQPIRRVGVDEKAFRKGHRYMTIVCDIEEGVVEFVSEGRNKESLRSFYQSRSPEQLAAIEAVAMDMHEPYVQSTLEELPLAAEKIVYDRFHIMQHMNQAVDKVRRQEHRELLGAGDDRLKKSKYLWLRSQDTLTTKQAERLDAIHHVNLKTGRAWAIKETLRDLWNNATPSDAQAFFEQWYCWAIRSRLKPVKKVAAMVKRRLANIITYCRHWITNAVSEGLNSKIMAIKRRAGGFRNIENFKNAIYFYCGGLDLYPR